MINQTSFSIIIPTFNRAESVCRALRSVTIQTGPEDQVIVVDDGSTDNTESRVKSKFPEVTYIRQENLGVSAARNHGIRISTRPWIAFLDSDDEWLPPKLEQQSLTINNYPETVVCHSEEIWIRNGTRVNPMKKHNKSGGWIFPHCLPLCAISPSSIVIHRSVFDQVGLFDETLPACEDYDLWLRIASRYPVTFIDEPLIIKHGGHDDQLSKKHWGMDRFRIKALKKILDKGELNPQNENAARTMLVKKARIYLDGAKKRDKHDEVEYYQSLCRIYSKPGYCS